MYCSSVVIFAVFVGKNFSLDKCTTARYPLQFDSNQGWLRITLWGPSITAIFGVEDPLSGFKKNLVPGGLFVKELILPLCFQWGSGQCLVGCPGLPSELMLDFYVYISWPGSLPHSSRKLIISKDLP